MTTATSVAMIVATITVKIMAGMNTPPSHQPASSNLVDMMKPVNAAIIKTSPWAKLMNPRTP